MFFAVASSSYRKKVFISLCTGANKEGGRVDIFRPAMKQSLQGNGEMWELNFMGKVGSGVKEEGGESMSGFDVIDVE